ncbi:MAG: glycosyltransferase family 4 protein [Solirubrobacterales bacterium]
MEAGERIKVVTLVHLVVPGGAEKIAVESMVGLDASRFDRVLCTSRQPTVEDTEDAREMVGRLRNGGVGMLELRRHSRYAIWAWWPLLRLLRRERVDVLHSHMFGSNVWACLLGKLARVPVIVCHEHMWSYRGFRIRAWIDRLLVARWSDAFVAVSESGRRSMSQLEGIPERDITLLRNGIPALPPGRPERVRAELAIRPDQPVVVSTGVLRSEKAYEVLVEAASKLVAAAPGLRVLIAGEGWERQKLEALIAKLGLGEVVTLLGMRSDIPDVLAAGDVAVCCSDFEGGPLSVMEYMAAGLPVVATEVGGLPELVRDGETGVLIPPRNPAALATAIGGLLGDSQRRRDMGRAGMRMREDEYGIDAFIQRLEALYDGLLKRS